MVNGFQDNNVVKNVNEFYVMDKSIPHIRSGRPAQVGQLILERRCRIVSKVLSEQDKWGRLLDLGCGNGAQTVYFVRDCDRVIGLDFISLKDIEGSEHISGFDFIQGSLLDLPFSDDSFDTVTSFEVLEHVQDDEIAVREVRRVLRKNGLFIFTVPNRWWIFETHGAVIPGLNWVPWNRVPFLSWLPKGVHDRIARARIFTIKQALSLTENQGLKPVEWGYVTAPLDVLPEGYLRRQLRKTLFGKETTSNPFLAVNLYLSARKI